MGCRNTKNRKEDEDENQIDDLNEIKLTPVKDRRQPLDARQLFKLKQSWKGIKRKMEETGIEMFIRLFKSNTSIISLFTKFNDCENEDDMRNNEALEYHATFVMSTLDDAISNFDNYDLCSQTLHRIGATHIRFVGFNEDYFRLVKSHFLEAVRTTLDDRYTPYMNNVYEVAITFIIDSLIHGYRSVRTGESEKENDENSVANENTEKDTGCHNGDKLTSSETRTAESNMANTRQDSKHVSDSEMYNSDGVLMKTMPQNGTAIHQNVMNDT